MIKIKNNYLEILYFFILLLWTVSPFLEYVFKNYHKVLYTYYFNFIIYFIGICGIILYIFYLFMIKKKNLNIKQFIPEILLLILLIWSTISSFLSNYSNLSFFGERYRKEGLIVYIMYAGFILLASIITNKKYIKYLLKSIIIVCLIITIIPLFKNNFSYVNFSNVFHNLNHYGYYLMINVMLSLFMFINSNKLIKKIIYMLIYIFFLYLLIVNNTFGSYLAIFITLIFMFIYSLVKKHQRINVILVIIIFVLTSFVVSNYNIRIGETQKQSIETVEENVSTNITTMNSDIIGIINNDENVIDKAGNSRWFLWREAWNYTLQHPIFGGGFESLKYHNVISKSAYYGQYNDRPHNIIIQVAAFIGIPGAIIYVALILYIAISNLKIMKKDDLHIMIYFTAMSYFISSLFHNSMFYTSPYFMILLGLLIGFNRRSKIKLKK